MLVASAVALLLVSGAIGLHSSGYDARVSARLMGAKTVGDRVVEYGAAVHGRLVPKFATAGVPYPPASVTLVGLKEERRLDVYAADGSGQWRFIVSYPVWAASGETGPKLKRGDRQVPEGIYAIESLNPNSRFHLSLRVGFPNAYDPRMADADGRTDLGTDIMVHGGSASVGCLAMGDNAAEDLFVLAAEVGTGNVKLILAPCDLRTAPRPGPKRATPVWCAELYDQIDAALRELPQPALR
jgi:hypothetical protein